MRCRKRTYADSENSESWQSADNTRPIMQSRKNLQKKVKEEQQKVDIIFNFVGEIHLPTDLQTEQKEATKQKKTHSPWTELYRQIENYTSL